MSQGKKKARYFQRQLLTWHQTSSARTLSNGLPVALPIPKNATEVYCPWYHSFGSRHDCGLWKGNRNGCPYDTNHLPFIHENVSGLVLEPLECPFWHSGNCRRTADACKFAHYHTSHGQRHYKPHMHYKPLKPDMSAVR